jgi:hypothetical protein
MNPQNLADLFPLSMIPISVCEEYRPPPDSPVSEKPSEDPVSEGPPYNPMSE